MYDYTERFTWVEGGASKSSVQVEPAVEVVDAEFVFDDEIAQPEVQVTVYLDIEAARSLDVYIAPGSEASEFEMDVCINGVIQSVYAFAKYAYVCSGSVCPLSSRTIDGMALEVTLSY